MNLDLWLVFLGGALLSAALALMVPIVALSTEALRASAAAWPLLKGISVLWLLVCHLQNLACASHVMPTMSSH